MINIIWIILIGIGIAYGLVTNNAEIINNTIIDSTKMSLEMLLKIFPVLALWMGLTKIAEKSGLLYKLSLKLCPFLNKLFPDIPKDHESLGLIASNIVANIFGLGNASTPLGLKAMKSLQRLNKNKEVASRSMITFLVINTSGLTLIPTTIISLRMVHKSNNPTIIVFACILSTLCATVGGLIIDRVLARRYKD